MRDGLRPMGLLSAYFASEACKVHHSQSSEHHGVVACVAAARMNMVEFKGVRLCSPASCVAMVS